MVTDGGIFPDEIWVGSVRYVREAKPGNAGYPVAIVIDACFCSAIINTIPHDWQSGCSPAYTVGTA